MPWRLEGRQPKKPAADERFYLQRYPDVAADIEDGGRVKSAFDQLVGDGYAEGQLASITGDSPGMPDTVSRLASVRHTILSLRQIGARATSIKSQWKRLF